MKTAAAKQGGIVIPVDRNRPVNPGKFLIDGWKVVDEDERSSVLSEIDLKNLHFETMVDETEKYISGEEKLRRLKASGLIRLDIGVFLAFLYTPEVGILLEDRLHDIEPRPSCIFFDGSIIQDTEGKREVLYLQQTRYGWSWGCRSLTRQFTAFHPSVVLPPL